MKVYKKLFRYVPDNKLIGYLAIIISGISAFFMVYGYYYIYKFLLLYDTGNIFLPEKRF